MGWKERYDKKLITPEMAILKLKAGMSIFLGTACGEPQTLVEAMLENEQHIDDAEIIHFLSLGFAPYD